ncbi:uncharacterized protein H6S33_010900 [Morchella sextelata]|uniref:uncharacterized protein n=1 Tax=Morchella sextelata TaxID=1174677 RepID=UPI001D056243|nr:uncharacterized protein H6S33_010900 [Morchella sextelata]KAH0611635.1 hypothetical protein H6S33_010900 [Morchella sextelata]
MTNSWNRDFPHYTPTQTMHAVNSRDRNPLPSIAPEALRRTPPPSTSPQRDEPATPPPATDPFYLPRLGKAHASDIPLYERFVGWYDFWNMHKRVFLNLCQVPSILHMQPAVRDLCWNEKSRVTNVARGGLNRLIIWVEINRSVWLPRDWFENLRVEGGGVVGKDNGKKYIAACTSKKDAWYAMKREQLAGFPARSTQPPQIGA